MPRRKHFGWPDGDLAKFKKNLQQWKKTLQLYGAVMGMIDPLIIADGYYRLSHPAIKFTIFGVMSTVFEIQAAIEKLPSGEFSKLLAWIEEYEAATCASDALFAIYDGEERFDAK